MTRGPAFSATTLAGLVLLTSTPAEAASKQVRLHVQGWPADLDHIEKVGEKPEYKRIFEDIDYGALEDVIDKQIDDVIPWKKKGTIDCSGDCPDLHWKVTFNPKFEFTKTNQPKIQKVGPSGQATVNVSLDLGARFELKAHVWGETSLEKDDFEFELYTNLGLKADATIKLWPQLSVQGLEIDLTKGKTNVDYDIEGMLVKLGAKWGSLLGTTPGGTIFGGPLAFAGLGALAGSAVADLATQVIDEKIAVQVGTSFSKANEKLDDIAKGKLDAKVAEANDLKAKLLDSDLPGIGKSINELATKFGANVEVHTVTPNGNLYASAVLRFDPKPGAGFLHGELQLPSQSCAELSYGGTVVFIPLPGKNPNSALDAKLGQPCTSVLANASNYRGGSIASRAWLGADPKKVLGSTAESRPNWRDSGKIAWKGNLQKVGDAYVCRFDVDDVPNAAVLSLEVRKGSTAKTLLHGAGRETRLLAVTGGGKTKAFDHEFDAIAEDSSGKPKVVLGGPMGCNSGGKDSALPGLAPNKVKEFLDLIDPDKCPNCGVRRVRNSQIYEVTDKEAFLGTPIGRHIDGLVRGKARTQ